MARDHARIDVEIWNDMDFRKLTAEEQHTYFMLVTSPKLSYCGVIDYVPSRFRGLANGLTPTKFKSRIATLKQHRFVVVDEDTAEILVRSYVRYDGVLKQPNVTKAMAGALRQVISIDIRDAVMDELARARREDPDAKGWNGLADSHPELLAEIKRRTTANPSTKGYENGWADP